MTTPTINDLPVASIANDTDQLLIRQPAGALGTDKSIQAQLLRNINISGLPILVTPPTAPALINDLFMIARGSVNYQIRYDQVTFVSGIKMWFYHNLFTEVSGWSLVSTTDNLIAVKGGSEYTTGGQVGGTWQQVDHSLTIAEMPNHYHWMESGNTQSNNHANYMRPSRYQGDTNPRFTDKTGKGVVGGFGDNATHDNYGSSQGHNHGSTWRPRANVGIILKKN